MIHEQDVALTFVSIITQMHDFCTYQMCKGLIISESIIFRNRPGHLIRDNQRKEYCTKELC